MEDSVLNDNSVYGSVNSYGGYEVHLQQKLKFYFMNPCDKFRAKRRFPWKLLMQLIKIVLVTIQLAMFGFDRSNHVNFVEKSSLSFNHLYLKKWEASYETLPYPPASGIYAIYTVPEFYGHVDYTLSRYNTTQDIAIGTYDFSNDNETAPPVYMCKEYYTVGKMHPSNQSYEYDARVEKECFPLYSIDDKFDSEAYLESINKTVQFDRTIRISLNFTLKTIHLKALTVTTSPDCYRFNIQITFDNSDHNGQMPVTLDAVETALKCRGRVIYTVNDETAAKMANVLLDAVVIIVSLLSAILCLRSIYRAHFLMLETDKYFTNKMEKKLTVYERLEFLNMWYILIIINDCLTVIGSILKITIETKNNHNYEACGVLLGTGNLLVWFGVLRYLGFFEKYNILILTMKKAAPNIMRFLVCSGIFYFGFTVCGWVVLGPYHMKFRTLSSASECLFSLVNGDDMYVTFSIIGDRQPDYIWWFSRLYLYAFVSFFIYAVLNLFTAVILDTYEILKQYYENGFPKSSLQQFIEQIQDRGFPLPGREGCGALCCCIPSQCCYGGSHGDESYVPHAADERTSLVTS